MQNQLVVVGASLAGLHAVRGARSAGYSGPITLVGSECHLPYDRPPLSKQHLGEHEVPPEKLAERAELEETLDVKLLLGSSAIGVDLDRRVLNLSNGDIRYGALVIATGSDAKHIPGTSAIDAVVSLRTYEDAQRIRQRLRPGANIVVIGAGLIGSEVASSAATRGARVTLVEASTAPLLRVVGSEVGALIAQTQLTSGIDLKLGVVVERIDSVENGATVTLSDGSMLKADLVVVGIGSTPATAWLTESGLKLEDDRSIACDAHLCAAQGVYAAGDVITWWNGAYQSRVRMENWTNAMSQGRHAGRNAIAGQRQTTPYVGISYVWSDLHGIRIQIAGTIENADLEVIVPGDPLTGLIAVYRRGNTALGIVSADQSSAMARGKRLLAKPGNFDAVVETLQKAATIQAVMSEPSSSAI